ncbi:tumor necrosis factor receptor superfamily member 1B isoform 2-T4 [Spinachia spinachia]
MDAAQLCCNKCPPGEHMVRRPPSTCGIECQPCIGLRYSDTYNEEMGCEICENCNKSNMEYYSPCSTTRNAVCRCKAGYRCRDDLCKQCVPIPSTKPTLPPPTTGAVTTLLTTSQPVKDTVWFLVIIALLCGGITMAAAAKIKPLLLWIKSKHGYVSAKDPQPVSPCFEDEEVSTPIQEVLGKCEV